MAWVPAVSLHFRPSSNRVATETRAGMPTGVAINKYLRRANLMNKSARIIITLRAL